MSPSLVLASLGGIMFTIQARWRLRNVNFKIFEKNMVPSGTWFENSGLKGGCDQPKPRIDKSSLCCPQGTLDVAGELLQLLFFVRWF